MNELEADVVIVGAGLAGLVAARQLMETGRVVVVLEARNRVGGRVHSVEFGNEFMDLGGRWTGPGQSRLKALADELGIAYGAPHFMRGDSVYVKGVEGVEGVEGKKGEKGEIREKREVLRGARQSVPADEMKRLVTMIDEMACKVPLDAPWKARQAVAWDSLTLNSWMEVNLPPALVRHLTDVLMDFLPHPRDVSMLHALFYLHSNGGLASILGLDCTPHDSEVFTGGTHQLPEGLAGILGDRILMSSKVGKIKQDSESVTVISDRLTVHGKYAIMAIPGVLAGRLDYSPALPPQRDYLNQRMPIRGKICAGVMFEEPFWLEDGLNGFARSDNLVAWSNSGDASPASLAILLTLDYSMEIAVQSPENQKRSILYELERCYGSAVHKTVKFASINWAAEPLSRGCNSYFPPGVWTSYGHTIREPVGRIHWAGAEYSAVFVGQMEGAVRSGLEVSESIDLLLSA